MFSHIRFLLSHIHFEKFEDKNHLTNTKLNINNEIKLYFS